MTPYELLVPLVPRDLSALAEGHGASTRESAHVSLHFQRTLFSGFGESRSSIDSRASRMRQLLSEIKAGPLGMATASRVEAWVSVMVHRSSDDEVGITRHERSVLDSAFACRASQMSTQEYMLRA